MPELLKCFSRYTKTHIEIQTLYFIKAENQPRKQVIDCFWIGWVSFFNSLIERVIFDQEALFPFVLPYRSDFSFISNKYRTLIMAFSKASGKREV